MAAPSVGKNLPNSEFIELYNRDGVKTFNLKGYKFYNGSVNHTIDSNFYLKPKQYVIVYKKKTGIDFSRFGPNIPMAGFISLSNPGDTFHLVSPNGEVIDAASYDVSFYQDSKKASSSWTLERINTKAPCSPRGWVASKDTLQGTPGQQNSMIVDSSDNIASSVERYYMSDNKTIELVFDKSLNRDLAQNTASYVLKDSLMNIITIKSANSELPMYQIVHLKLKDSLKIKMPYKLLVKNTSLDCQNLAPLSKMENLNIQSPEKIAPNDLIVNEILFNPEVGGSRFIELYNRSEKVIDIANLTISNIQKADAKTIKSNYLLFPRQYVAITEDPSYVEKRYNAGAFYKHFFKYKLPAWGNDSGNVSFYYVDTFGTRNKIVVLDNFTYQKSWHNPLLANTEGVSLERIDPEKPANDPTNWQSAAQTVGYATPAQKNSQYLDPSVLSEPKSVFALEKKSFSPDEDGFEDFLRLNYRFDKAGYVATIRIFDDKGRLVKTLINNTLLSTEGTLKWEGDTDEGLKTRQGIYIIAIEWISTTGKVDRMKLACVVAGRL